MRNTYTANDLHYIRGNNVVAHVMIKEYSKNESVRRGSVFLTPQGIKMDMFPGILVKNNNIFFLSLSIYLNLGYSFSVQRIRTKRLCGFENIKWNLRGFMIAMHQHYRNLELIQLCVFFQKILCALSEKKTNQDTI